MRRMIDEKLYAEKEQEAWITPTLLNGWINSNGTTKYMKDTIGGIAIELTATGGTNETVFILPTKYRPSQNIWFIGYEGRAYINSDGIVRLVGTPTGASHRLYLYFKVV